MFGATELEMEIMRILMDGKRKYGLELVKSSDLLKKGTIYVYLTRMEDKEWLQSEAEKEPGVAGMPRRRYWITGKGQRVYDRAVSMKQHLASFEEGMMA